MQVKSLNKRKGIIVSIPKAHFFQSPILYLLIIFLLLFSLVSQIFVYSTIILTSQSDLSLFTPLSLIQMIFENQIPPL